MSNLLPCLFDRFKFSTVTTGAFRDCFLDFVNKVYADSNAPTSPVRDGKKSKGKKSKGKSVAPAGTLTISPVAYKQVQSIKWVELFCSTGMPRHVPDYSNSLSDTAVKLARMWIENMDNVSVVQTSQDDMKGWSSHQIQIFLEEFINHTLPEGTNYSLELLNKMDAAYNFTSSHNSEIMFRWQTLCLRSNMESILPYVVSFITSQGRMKFIRPLYRAMGMSKIGGKLALGTFQQFKDTYHPIARKMVESDLIKIAALHKEEEEDDDGK
ncbi:hypothetical protein EON65_15420 [archaeon]|nr:MAG: hypothetical protein EON65_15420 [archaeon]